MATMLLLCGTVGVMIPVSATQNPALPETIITEDSRVYSWVDNQTQTYTYDFSSTEITYYSQDENLATASLRTNMVFDGKVLSCKPDKTFSFGSAQFLGDDYGVMGGEVSLNANITGGDLSVGLRLAKKLQTIPTPVYGLPLTVATP